MNLFLSAYLVGAFVYGVHVYWTVQISKARRACGIFHDHDHMLEVIEKRGLMSFVYFFGVFLFPLSLAYDCVLNGQQVEKLRDAKKNIDKLEAQIAEWQVEPPTIGKVDAEFFEPLTFCYWLRARDVDAPPKNWTDESIRHLARDYDESVRQEFEERKSP